MTQTRCLSRPRLTHDELPSDLQLPLGVLANEGVVEVIREVSAVGIDTMSDRGQLSCRQIPASALAERTGVLSRGWHGLFQS